MYLCNMKTTFIYALTEPEDITKIRYIGKTNDPVNRLSCHITKAEKEALYKTHKNCWIRSILKKGMKPNMIILDEVPVKEWSYWEIYYYHKYKNLGYKLTNVEDALGESGIIGGHRVVTQEEIDKKKATFNKRIRENPEAYRCKPILKINKDTNEIVAKYESARICCEAEGFRPEKLRCAINGFAMRGGKKIAVNHIRGFKYIHEEVYNKLL